MFSSSHAAALKAGYDALGDEARKSMPVTFFASRQTGLASMRARDGKLVAIKDGVTADLKFTSGGHAEVLPENFDLFIIHAVGLDFQYGVFDGLYRSSDFVRQWVIAAISKSINLRLYASLRSITTKPILLSPRPYVSEAHPRFREAVAGSMTAIYDMREMLAASVLRELQGPVQWLPQPAETIAHMVFTRREFSEGSMRLAVDTSTLDKKHNDGDFVHMNAKYGESFWTQVLSRKDF